MFKSLFSFLKSLRRRRRPFKLTKGGWIFILYTVGVGAGAINTGNNLLYLLFGLFLGVILASGFLSDFSLWGLSAEVDVSTPGLAKNLMTLPFTLNNSRGRIPGLSLTVEMTASLQGKDYVMRKFIPVVFHGEKIEAAFTFRPPVRGLLYPRQVRFVTRFPFGLFVKWWTHSFEEEDDARSRVEGENKGWVIYPSGLDTAEADGFIDVEGQDAVVSSGQKGEGAAVFGLRDFRDEDNPRRIHWKASARRGVTSEGRLRFLFREMESDQRPEASLVWPELDEVLSFSIEEKEKFVQFTAAAAREFQKEGRLPTLFISDGGKARLRQVLRPGVEGILEFLSLFDDPNFPQKEKSALLGDLPPSYGLRNKVDVMPLYRQWKEGLGKEALHG